MFEDSRRWCAVTYDSMGSHPGYGMSSKKRGPCIIDGSFENNRLDLYGGGVGGGLYVVAVGVSSGQERGHILET